MEDLNDFIVFSQIVEHHGFTNAARSLGMARSSVCRRIGQLEERLGVRLVQRSTRHFAVTDLGMEYYGYCQQIVAQATAAYEHVACARAKPWGVVRVSCPPLIAQLLVNPLIPAFTDKNPEVLIALEASDGKVDLDENADLFIRLRQVPSEDSELIKRSLGVVQQVLVASPSLLQRHDRPSIPDEAGRIPSVSYGTVRGPHFWRLLDSNGRELQIRHEPKLIADDMVVVRDAALRGVGIALLPLSVCVTEIRQGLLEPLLLGFPAPLLEIQVLFGSRRGMLPAVRSFIDFLSAHCASEVPNWQIKRMNGRGAHDSARFWSGPKGLNHQLAVASIA